MDECIFCKIVKGEIPSAKVYEDESAMAFMDIMPVHKGHALVIPKEHHATILDIPEDLLAKVTAALKKVSAAVKAGANADGISVIQSNFKAANQLVPHLHFHVIPRFEDDGLKCWPQKSYEDGEMAEFAQKIKEFM